jgi:hypothetical protein
METNDPDYWRKGSKASKKSFDKRSFYYDPKAFRSSNVSNSTRCPWLTKIVLGIIVILFVMSMF